MIGIFKALKIGKYSVVYRQFPPLSLLLLDRKQTDMETLIKLLVQKISATINQLALPNSFRETEIKWVPKSED